MSDLDKLSIGISASADKAESAIDSLIDKLSRLNRSLDLGNLTHFTDQLKSISQAASGLKDVASNIRAVASAGSSLAKLTGFKTTNDQMEEVEATASKMAKSLADYFDFGETKAGIANLNTLRDGIKKTFDLIGQYGNGKDAGFLLDFTEFLTKASRSHLPIVSDFKELADFVGSKKFYVDDAFLGGFKDAKQTLQDIKSVFGGITSDRVKGVSISDISEELTQLGVVAGEEEERLEDIIAKVKEYRREYNESIVKGEEQITKGLVPQSFFDDAADKLVKDIHAAYDKIYAEAGKKDVFGEIVPSLERLQGITLPDFSQLGMLADSLKNLQSVNASKISAIAAAIAQFQGGGNINAGGFDNISSVIDTASEAVSGKMLPAVIDVRDYAETISQNFGNIAPEVEQVSDIIDAIGEDMANISSVSLQVIDTREIANIGNAFAELSTDVIQAADGIDVIGEGTSRFTESIGTIIDAGNNLHEIGSVAREAGDAAEQSGERAERATKKAKQGSIDLLANLIALGHEIGNIANAFDRLGDRGIQALKMLYKPAQLVIDEYRERFSKIGDVFTGFADKAKKSLDNLSKFWKRTMKTFTFMLVRKAITAVMNEINDATESLAKWSKMFGTVFNDSMSQITSNFSYIARSLVGAFEPIINFIVPALNMLSDALVSVAGKIGEFFAAMTGQGYYMAAKRQVTDYADSVDKANKAQKNLISGLDDLNIITTPTSTASGMDDLAAQWEKVDVSDTMKDWAEKVKDVAKRLFDPIKEAWDEAGDHVVDGFKYMLSEIGKLGKSIGRDFMIVWEQPETEKIFENLLHTVGYIEEGIGNIAKRFHEAWDEGDKGLHILENIRDIIKIITGHVENMAKTFSEWADDLNFNPLLEAVEDFTEALEPLTDFAMGVIEDLWERIVLRHWKWEIETGIPHLLETIVEIIDSFDFEDLRKKLQPLMDAFETMRENIETGIVDAIGNLGQRVGEFSQSEEFASFLDNVAWFMDQITAERVEKLFTALGTAVLDIAEALIKFVGSETFKNFMQKIFDWYDSHSSKDIAGWIKGIALAIAAFKFGAFTLNKMSGFFKFVSVLQSWKNMKTLTTEMKNLGKGLETVGKGAETAKGAGTILSKIGGGLKTIAMAGITAFDIGIWSYNITSLFKAFKGYKEAGDALDGIRQKYTELYNSMNEEQQIEWLKMLGVESLEEAIEQAEKDFEGVPTNLWEGFKQGMGYYFGENGVGVIQLFKDAFGGVVGFVKGLFGIESPSKVFFEIAGYIAEGFFNGLIDGFANILSWLNENLAQPIINFFADAGTWLLESGAALIGGLADGIESMKEALSQKWDDIKDAASKKWEEIKTSVYDIAENLRGDLEEKWEEAKKNAVEKFEQLKDDAVELFTTMRNKVIEKAKEMKEKVLSKIQELKTNALSKIEGLKNEAVSKFNTLKEEAIGKFNALKDGALGAFENLKTNAEITFNNMKTSVVGIAGNIAEDVSHKFWDMVDWASDAFWSVVDNASTIMSKVPGAISSALSGVGSAVSGAFNNASSWLTGVGEDIVSGITSGINKGTSSTSFFNATNSIGKLAENFTRKRLDSHSPSRVFMDIGEDVVEGFNLGIEKNDDSTRDVLKDWMAGISKIEFPTWNLDAAMPKSNLRTDTYSHTDLSGIAQIDNSGIEQSVRQGVAEAVGSLLLPYLNDIAQSSRTTANKKFGITQKEVGQAAAQYARDYQMRTGRLAYGTN